MMIFIRTLKQKFLQKTSLRVKLLIVTFTLIILPLTVTGVIMYYNTSNMYIDSVYQLSNMSLDNASRVLDSRLSLALNTADTVAGSSEVQRILSRDLENYSLEEQLNDMKVLSLYLRKFVRESEIVSVRLSVRDGLIYSNEGQNFINIDDLDYELKFNSFLEQKVVYPCYWLNNTIKGRENIALTKDVVSCIKVIHNVNNYDEILGCVFVDIPINSLNSILVQADLTGDSILYAVDQNNVVRATAGNKKVSEEVPEMPFEFISSNSSMIRLANTKYQLHVQELTQSNWKILFLVPLSKIQNTCNRLIIFTLVLLVTLAGITLLMGNLIYKNTFNRMQKVVISMQNVQEGNLDIELPVIINDEIGQIEQNYNYMIRRIRDLIKETYSLAEKTKNAELKALQAQINPHFLYNTINTISWAAMDYGAEKVCRMLKSLSDFYKLSLQPSKQEIKLKDEIHHIELYIDIQNMRYKDGVKLTIDIPEEIKDYAIPNMILQPLVENSVIHGIMAKETKRGEIKVDGTLCENDILLSIIDSGIGMNETTLKRATQYKLPNEEYGIYNIQERLHLKYGKKYGLFFASRFGYGTRVEIRIPTRISEEDGSITQ